MSTVPSEALQLPAAAPIDTRTKEPRHLRPVPDDDLRIVNPPSISAADVRQPPLLENTVSDPREQFAPYDDPEPDALPSNVFYLRNRHTEAVQHERYARQLATIRRITHTIGAAFIEAELGLRSFTQLSSWLEHELFHNLRARVEHRAMQKYRAARSGDASSRKVPTITAIGVRAAATVGGEWESSMTIRVGQRARAIAMRLQLQRNGWRVIALEVG